MHVRKSVVNNDIIRQGSITLANPDGDLIIDALIVSIGGNITLAAKNIYCTSKAKIIADSKESKSQTEGNIIIQCDDVCHIAPVINCPGLLKITGFHKPKVNSVIANTHSPKQNICAELRSFNYTTLRKAMPSKKEKENKLEVKRDTTATTDFLEKYEVIYKDKRPQHHKVVFWSQLEKTPPDHTFKHSDKLANYSAKPVKF